MANYIKTIANYTKATAICIDVIASYTKAIANYTKAMVNYIDTNVNKNIKNSNKIVKIYTSTNQIKPSCQALNDSVNATAISHIYIIYSPAETIPSGEVINISCKISGHSHLSKKNCSAAFRPPLSELYKKYKKRGGSFVI